jgi:hypothetical protein
VCGAVIARRRKGERIDPRLLLAGLLDWSGDAVPKSEEVEGVSIKELGFAQIKAITENGGDILGEVRPSWGYGDEIEAIDSISTWGFGVVRVYAEKHFGKKPGQ